MLSIDEDPREFTDDEMRAALQQMGDRARREAFAAGKPIVFLRGSHLVWLFPDGHEECIERSSAAASLSDAP